MTVVSQQELARGGNDSLGRALQSLPFSTGSAPNTNVNNGGDGSTRVDLRGLTPKRTLVLLNGRRLPNGGVGADSSVDIDSLPLSMVERVEVLTTGASTVYGADAIGGVVNVITRKDVDGVEVGAQFSQAEQGDGETSRAQLLLGTQTSHGHWASGWTWWIKGGLHGCARLPGGAVPRRGRIRRAREFGTPGIPDGRFMVPAATALAFHDIHAGCRRHRSDRQRLAAGDGRRYVQLRALICCRRRMNAPLCGSPVRT